MWQASLAFALVQNLDLRVRCPHFQDYKDAKREGQSQSSFCIWPVKVNPKYFTLLEYDFWLNYAWLFPLKKSRKCEQFCSSLMTGMRCPWRYWLHLSHSLLDTTPPWNGLWSKWTGLDFWPQAYSNQCLKSSSLSVCLVCLTLCSTWAFKDFGVTRTIQSSSLLA
jgi:hypothetical protein